ncbi:18455_t:CDS:1, partial [Gigaspora margarita]
VNLKVCKKYLELFKDRHSLALAIYTYEDELYLNTNNEQELLVLLSNRTTNSDYYYIVKLFQQYYKIALGDCNGSLMFKCLADAINDYNKLDKGKAIL